MADDVQDIYVSTNAGTEWQSLSALAAEQVEAKLPIESVDGTVKLEGASSVFTVSTGGLERLTASEPETVIASRYVKQSPTAGTYSVHQWTAVDDTVLSTITQYNADYPGDSTLDVGPLGLAIGSPKNIGLSFAADGQFVVGNNVPRFTVDVNQCVSAVPIRSPSIRGLADNDGSVTLGASFVVSTGVEERLTIDSVGRLGVGTKSANVVNYFGNDQDPDRAGTSCYAFYVDGKCNKAATEYIVYTSSPEIPAAANLNSLIHFQTYYKTGGGTQAGTVIEQTALNVNGTQFQAGAKNNVIKSTLNSAADKENFVINATGTAPSYFGGNIQSPSISGVVGTDASVTLGDQATLTKYDGSEYVVTDAASIATKKYVDDNAGGPAYDDTQIKNDLAAEASTREDADTTLQANIDAKIWVGTTAQYLALDIREILPTTLYCLTD